MGSGISKSNKNTGQLICPEGYDNEKFKQILYLYDKSYFQSSKSIVRNNSFLDIFILICFSKYYHNNNFLYIKYQH